MFRIEPHSLHIECVLLLVFEPGQDQAPPGVSEVLRLHCLQTLAEPIRCIMRENKGCRDFGPSCGGASAIGGSAIGRDDDRASSRLVTRSGLGNSRRRSWGHHLLSLRPPILTTFLIRLALLLVRVGGVRHVASSRREE